MTRKMARQGAQLNKSGKQKISNRVQGQKQGRSTRYIRGSAVNRHEPAEKVRSDRRNAKIRNHTHHTSGGGSIDHHRARTNTQPLSLQDNPPKLLKMGRIKGEWMDIRLPDSLSHAPLHVIVQHLPLPAKMTSKLLRSKDLHMQGKQLRLRLFRREQPDFPSDWMDLNILYEDEFSLVIGKPAGIEVHPSEQGQRRTLAHGVAAYYEASGQQKRVRHIHRIDKETTGPVLYAKNEFAHYQFDQAMREKRIERIYLALAEGVMMQNKGTINKPIGQDRHHPTRRRVSETGDAAVTHYEVVERFADHTLVRLRLETGRTHQIRVHLSAIGHPLAGDGMYGGKRKLMSRQALHGEKLIWPHPWSGEKQQVHAPLPDDFARALEMLRHKRL